MNLKSIAKVFTGLLIVISVYGFTKQVTSDKYKCMIQMTNYSGEGAYIVVSLLNPEGDYAETLYVHGDDDEWYFDLSDWWNYYGKIRNDIDAITGATISRGKRAITVLEIDSSKIDKGYKIRFESAVEDQEYYNKDVEFEFTSENLKKKIEGKGFIRYIRLMPQH